MYFDVYTWTETIKKNWINSKFLDFTYFSCLLSGSEFEDEENMVEAVEIIQEFVKLKAN